MRYRAGYGCEFDEINQNARRRRMRALMLTPTPEVTPQWLVEDRRDEALTCWPYKAGGR
jgi:hypothetical protein